MYMDLSIEQLTDEPKTLKQIIHNLTCENNQYKNHCIFLEAENKNLNEFKVRCDSLEEKIKELTQYKGRCIFLEEELRLLKDRLYNKKSEKLTEDELLQGRLFDEVESNFKREEKEEATVKVKSYRRRKGGKRRLPESLPRKII